MDLLTAEEIRAGLGTTFIGRNLLYLPETGSTNDEAKRLARKGAVEGTLVIADYQTDGRGRLDRRWVAPPGSSLLMSLVFRPRLAPHQVQRLTMICGLGLADAVESETELRIGLKWPNDLVANGAKIGGILTEVELLKGHVEYAVVGIGLNVNLDRDELPSDLLVPATSLSLALGRPVPRLVLLQLFLRNLESRVVALASGLSPHEEWAERLSTLGQAVTVSTFHRVFSGVAEGVDADGALQIRLPNGRLETVLAGDVTLRCPQ